MRGCFFISKPIYTEKAPKPIGPYSQAVLLEGSASSATTGGGGWLFLSGQIPLDPNGLVPEGIDAQTRLVMANMRAVLEAGGMGLENVVKTLIFLKDLKHFDAFNAVYAEFFKTPARSCVQVARLPKDVLVEVEAIAFKGLIKFSGVERRR